MKIYYEDAWIDNLVKCIQQGKTSIVFDYETDILSDIENALKSNNVEYQKYKAGEDGVEGYRNIIGIGGSSVIEYLSKNAFEYIYIPCSISELIYSIYNTKNQDNKRILPTNVIINKNIPIDKKELLGETIFSRLALGVEIPYYKNEEDFLSDAINNIDLLDKVSNDYFYLRNKFYELFKKENYNNLFILSLGILSLCLFGLSHNVNTIPALDFNDIASKIAKDEKICSYEVLSKLKGLKNLQIFRYKFKEQREVLKPLIETSYLNAQLNVKLYKSFCENFGYGIEVDVEKIFEFIKKYSILVSPENILFQIWL